MAGLVIINGINTVRQIGETTGSWLLRSKLYSLRLASNSLPSHSDTLELKTRAGSNYKNMRFLVGDVPANNIIFGDKNNNIIEFVNAKIRVTKENTIVKTALVSRSGTIKEYIAAKDYVIDISGDIITNSNLYPVEEMEKVNEFLNSPEEFYVSNVFLDVLNICKVVFESGDFDQQSQKYFNVLPFKFKFTSDDDPENFYGLNMN